MLQIRNFSKGFNDRLILKIDDLALGPGAHWIRGDNGSGKSTLFKCLAGILPFQGDIAFADGIDIRKNPVAYRKRINYSEAEPQYPGFLTAKDLIQFIGKIKNSTLQEQESYAEHFGVTAYLESPCETYSSGMMKKLGLTLAFIGHPDVIILDEPLITLDDQARAILFELIRKKINEGITFLVSSHHALSIQDFPVTKTFLLENKTVVSL